MSEEGEKELALSMVVDVINASTEIFVHGREGSIKIPGIVTYDEEKHRLVWELHIENGEELREAEKHLEEINQILKVYFEEEEKK